MQRHLITFPSLALAVFAQEQAPEVTAPAAQAAAETQDPKPTPPPAKPKPINAPAQVMVTAEKWGARPVDELPRSISSISERLLRDAGAQSIEDAARFVPNTLVTGFSARRLSFPYVRGVGSGQGDPAVATFVDDVPQMSVSNTNLSFVGLDRVEVLRGPSGALWGRNTIGGAINLITKKPDFRHTADMSATLGNFSSQLLQVRASGPVSTPGASDTLAASFSASYDRRDGYTENDFTGNDIDYRDSTFARTQLLWTPDDRNTVRIIFHGEHTRDGGFVLSNIGTSISPLTGQPVPGLRENPYRINQDFEGETNRDTLAGSLIWNHESDGYDITSITSMQSWEIDEAADFDFSALDLVRRFTEEEETYVYQELRAGSNGDYDPSDRASTDMRWLVGLSGFYSDEERSAANDFRQPIPAAGVVAGTDSSAGEFRSWSMSLFGQVSKLLGNGVEVSGALRYDYEDKKADISRTFTDPSGTSALLGSTNDCRTFSRLLPRASVAFRPNDEVTHYLTIARGFKAGGFNLTAPSGRQSFGTENSWTYEAGVKSRWLDDRLQVNAALFWIDWEDMQLSQFDPAAGGYVSNAGESTSRGLELEVVHEVNDELQLFGTAGYLDTEFDRFTDQYGQNAAGKSLPFAPDWTVGLGAQYDYELPGDYAAFARLDYFHVGQFYYDAGNLGGEQYDLTNLRVGLNYQNWRADLFVQNAFDEEYVAIAFQANPGDPTQFVGQNGAPRTFGLSVRVTF